MSATLTTAAIPIPETMMVPQLSPAQWCQAFFALSAAGVLAVRALPAHASARLLAYGARGVEGTSTSASGRRVARDDEDGDSLTSFLGRVASIGRVPHRWFIHFYILSLGCSLFWAQQFLTGGQTMRELGRWQARTSASSSSSSSSSSRGGVPTATTSAVVGPEQTVLVWTMLAGQGLRRLYECVVVMSPGGSRMWFVHWLLGLGFYFFVNVAVWIEGSASLLALDSLSNLHPSTLLAPKPLASLTLYFLASAQQHRLHHHLASLEKYTLPHEGWFGTLLCAHYAAECLVYLSLAVGAAPAGSVVNATLLAALGFVVVNLGATGVETRRWYVQRFGEERVAGRRIMIPGVF